MESKFCFNIRSYFEADQAGFHSEKKCCVEIAQAFLVVKFQNRDVIPVEFAEQEALPIKKLKFPADDEKTCPHCNFKSLIPFYNFLIP
jgi:hypothetical protein